VNPSSNQPSARKVLSVQPKTAPILSDAEQHLRRIVAKAPVIFFAIDAEGKFTLSEGRALDKLGLQGGQNVGKSIFHLYSNYPSIIRDAQRALAGEEFSCFTELQDVGLSFETHWSPIRTKDGNSSGAIGVAVDISERSTNERARNEAETLYQNLVEQLSAVTYIAELGLESEWRFVSPQIEKLLGYSSAQWLSDPTNWIRHVHSEDIEIVKAAEEATLSGKSFRAEYRIFRRDGGMVWVNDSGSLVRGADNQQLLHGVLVDITEQKQLQSRLEQTERMEAVGQLASGVAHDFNNLLTIIKGYSSLLMERNPDGRDGHAAKEIRQAADRAASLTHQLLAFSRKQTLQPRVLDLNAIVRGLEAMLRRLLTENVDLVIRTSPDIGFVKADPVQMEQVLINLVVNARDAMPRGGRLIIETAGFAGQKDLAEKEQIFASPYATLSVSDTGIGMDAVTQARIFEPFFTTKEIGKGTGLGLATVYGIIKQSNGHIEVESEPGKGSAFRISLPSVDHVPVPARKPVKSEKPKLGTGTILLAEDEPLLRELGETILTQAGYTVITAGSSDSLRALIADHAGKVDLLLTDVVMPNISGPELVRIARERWSNLRVLFMSGYADDELQDLDRDAGFIQKPFTPAELTAKIAEVLAGAE
jgi:two-component system cell cycle sensor histidine kinase/response regulator CckA